MNWVGGIRDKVHRKSNLLKKQKEYFERMRFTNYNKKKLNQFKKGFSQDIVNLDFISQTIRNPFDNENVEKRFSKNYKPSYFNHKAFRSTKLGSQTKNYQHKPKTRLNHFSGQFSTHNLERSKEKFIQSTPLVSETNSLFLNYERKQFSGLNASQKYSMPSPILFQESCSTSSIHPLTLPTDNDSMVMEGSLHTNSSNSALWNDKGEQRNLEQTTYNDFLRHITSDSSSSMLGYDSSLGRSCDQCKGYDWFPLGCDDETNLPLSSRNQPHPKDRSIEDHLTREFMNSPHRTFSNQRRNLIDSEDVYETNHFVPLPRDDCTSPPTPSGKLPVYSFSPSTKSNFNPFGEITNVSLETTCPTFCDKSIQVNPETEDACTSPIKWQRHDACTQVETVK